MSFAVSMSESAGFAALLEMGVARARTVSAPEPMSSSFDPYFIIGSSSSQTLTATADKFGLVGMAGNDVLNGSSLSDFLVGDYFDPAALDYWYYGIGEPPIYDASIKGNDRLNGADGDDFLVDDLGNDTLYGGNGDDIFGVWVEQTGTNVYSGGEGYDKLYFDDAYNLGYETVKSAGIILDASASIEYVEFYGVGLAGTDGNDRFDFSGVESMIFLDESGISLYQFEVNLGAGNDKLNFGDSFFAALFVNGEAGDDTILGGDSADTLDGGAGVDSLKGGMGGMSIWWITHPTLLMKSAQAMIRMKFGSHPRPTITLRT